MARLARNVYHRKDGRFEGRFISDHDENGKAVYKAVYDRTYAGVLKKLEDAKAAFSIGDPKAAGVLTAGIAAVPRSDSELGVVDAMKAYLEAVRHVIKPSTYGVYVRYIDSYIEPLLGNMPCRDLPTDATQGFVNALIESGLSPVTVSAVFNFLKLGLKSTFPPNAFEVKMPKKRTKEMFVFSVSEQKRLEVAAKESDEINRVGVLLCLYTGLRVGELCGLRYEDVDLNMGVLYVRQTIQRIRVPQADGKTKTELATLSPKSESSERKIPLPAFLVDLLKEHKRNYPGTYVLTSSVNKPVEPRNMQARFQRLLVKAGLKPTNFHSLRHSFATRALEAGFDVKTLSEILGHHSATVTLEKYAHSLDENKRKNMDSLTALFNQ